MSASGIVPAFSVRLLYSASILSQFFRVLLTKYRSAPFMALLPSLVTSEESVKNGCPYVFRSSILVYGHGGRPSCTQTVLMVLCQRRIFLVSFSFVHSSRVSFCYHRTCSRRVRHKKMEKRRRKTERDELCIPNVSSEVGHPFWLPFSSHLVISVGH